jgi:hypothetical protein
MYLYFVTYIIRTALFYRMKQVKLSITWAYNKGYIQAKFTRLLPNTKLNRQSLNSFTQSWTNKLPSLNFTRALPDRSRPDSYLSLSGIFLLAFASTVLLGSESRAICNHIYCLVGLYLSPMPSKAFVCVCVCVCARARVLLTVHQFVSNCRPNPRIPNIHYEQCTKVQQF